MDETKYFLALKTAFASEFAFYLKAHNFHWNVEGIHFKQFHDLFGDIYLDVHEQIDVFAEQIRAKGTYTPGSLSKFSMLSEIDDELGNLSAEEMLQVLYTDSEKMANIFKITYEMAENAGDHGLASFLADQQDAHKKYCWMLRASLK